MGKSRDPALGPGFRGLFSETVGKEDQGGLVPNLIILVFQAHEKSAEIPAGPFQECGSDGSDLVGFAVSDVLFHLEFTHKILFKLQNILKTSRPYSRPGLGMDLTGLLYGRFLFGAGHK